MTWLVTMSRNAADASSVYTASARPNINQQAGAGKWAPIKPLYASRLFPLKRKTIMNSNKLIVAVIVIILIAVFVWSSSQLKSGPNSLAPAASVSPSPATLESTTEAEQQERVTSDETAPRPEVHRQPPAKCLDGSALTVTGRDSNQTNYRCESGATGAYTN